MSKIYTASDRIKLGEFREEFKETFFRYRNDAQLMRFQDFRIGSREELDKFFEHQKRIDPGQGAEWKQIAIINNDDLLIGDCAIRRSDTESRIAEIGISLARDYHNKGLATEALKLLSSYAFNVLGIHKCTAVVDCRNLASARLFERVGFLKEAVLRKHYWDRTDQEWFDEWHYGLLAGNTPR